jgi:hypothetical protein
LNEFHLTLNEFHLTLREGERSGVYRVLVGKPEGKILLREDIIKMNLQEVGCGGHGLDRAGSG